MSSYQVRALFSPISALLILLLFLRIVNVFMSEKSCWRRHEVPETDFLSRFQSNTSTKWLLLTIGISHSCSRTSCLSCSWEEERASQIETRRQLERWCSLFRFHSRFRPLHANFNARSLYSKRRRYMKSNIWRAKNSKGGRVIARIEGHVAQE